MATSKRKDGFFQSVSSFFNKVAGADTVKIGDGQIQTYDQPAQQEELERRREMQVFRQFLQTKNQSIKHTELYDEYRRMDNTFPIINAALRLYTQEVCLSGETIVTTPGGDKTIGELYKQGKKDFYVKSYDQSHDRIEWNMVKAVKNNGVKPVYRVTVFRNESPDTAAWDKKVEATFKCTDNHKIMVAPGQFKELKDMREGDEIWSMYMWIDPSCSCKMHKFNKTYIEKIELVGDEEVFDLVDVSPNHHFVIKLTDAFHISVHNCTKDTEGNVVQIITDNKKVKKLIEDCFFKNLKLNSSSYLHVRSMLKFGNHFSWLDTRKGVGVIDLIHLPPEFIRIQILQDSDRLDDFRFQWWGSGAGVQFEPWEIVHWKNVEDIETEPYGQSILRSIVDTYRRIVLMREAMIVYRIVRAPQRLLFKIDTTGLNADEALRVAESLKKQMFKKPLVNAQTGEIDHKYNPISIEENLYMSTYEGDSSDVRVLEGASNLDAVEDYKIIKDDLFAGLLIPKSYLTFEEDLCLRSTTKLLTNEGVLTIKEIADIFASDASKKIYSLSCNKYGIITTGKILWCNSTKEVTQLYRITVNGHHVIEATDNHPFLLESLKYKRADSLQVGEKLRNMYEDEYKITAIDVIDLDEPELVYDLEVDEYHNFALECGIFVHNSNKAALAQEDLRFAGAIRQYQSHYVEGLVQIALVHLHINGCSREELESFTLQMNTNSTLAEKTRNELLQQRFDLFKSAWDPNNEGLNPMGYVQACKELLHFTDDEVKKSIQDQMIEKKIAWRLTKLTQDGTYQEPNEDKSAHGMGSENDLFAGLMFESESATSALKSILSEKLEKELAFLTKPITAAPNPKTIETVINKDYIYESRWQRQLKKAAKDLEM